MNGRESIVINWECDCQPKCMINYPVVCIANHKDHEQSYMILNIESSISIPRILDKIDEHLKEFHPTKEF